MAEMAQEGTMAHARKPSTDLKLQPPLTVAACINPVTAYAMPISSGTTPKSIDTVIPNLGTRALRGAPPVVELKNLVQDKLKLCAPDYGEVEEKKTQNKQLMYRCTVTHPLIPCSQVQGNWCNSKRLAKQDAANKALNLIYKQYGRT